MNRATIALLAAATALLAAAAPVAATPQARTDSVHVHRIRFGAIVAGAEQRLDATVSIRDGSGERVAGAVVSGEWFHDGVSLGDAAAVSNGGGHAQFRRHTPENGRHSFCVTGVTAAGLVYDRADNRETCDHYDWEWQVAPAASHVASIRVRLREQASRATAVVVVKDDGRAPVAGTTVVGTWTIDGGVAATMSAVTNARGKARVALANPPPAAELQFCVDDLVTPGLTYDPTANRETCETATWPGARIVHLDGLRMILRPERGRAIGRATVEDDSGNRIPGVSVTGLWRVNSVPRFESASVTNGNGAASSLLFYPPPSSSLEYCVTDIRGPGVTYDPASDQTSGCVTAEWP